MLHITSVKKQINTNKFKIFFKLQDLLEFAVASLHLYSLFMLLVVFVTFYSVPRIITGWFSLKHSKSIPHNQYDDMVSPYIFL